MAEFVVFHDMTAGLWAEVPGVTMGLMARNQVSITFTEDTIERVAEVNKRTATRWGIIDMGFSMTLNEIEFRCEAERRSEVPARYYDIEFWTRIRGVGN